MTGSQHIAIQKTKWAVLRGSLDKLEAASFLSNGEGKPYWTTDIRAAKALALKHKGHIVDVGTLMATIVAQLKSKSKRRAS